MLLFGTAYFALPTHRRNITMRDEATMDTRTAYEIQSETINSIVELQDEIEMLFPWKMSYSDNEIIISNSTIQLIINYIKQLKERIYE